MPAGPSFATAIKMTDQHANAAKTGFVSPSSVRLQVHAHGLRRAVLRESGQLAQEPRRLPNRQPVRVLRGDALFELQGADVLRMALTKLHGAFKVQFLCAQRGARVILNISAKFRRISSPD